MSKLHSRLQRANSLVARTHTIHRRSKAKTTIRIQKKIVESPTSIRDKTISYYISEVQTSPYKPVLWGWIRFKLYF